MTLEPAAVLATVAAGAVATLLRAEVIAWSRRRTGGARSGTWAVNLAGAFLLGLLVGVSRQGIVADATVLVVGSGFLGGLTTFSTWVVVVLRPDTGRATGLLRRDLLVHGVGMLLAGVAAAASGIALATAPIG